jgi:NADPH-dependent 2,4-dienoyl-CoA reductase/sulfur reductase-like enzyme
MDGQTLNVPVFGPWTMDRPHPTNNNDDASAFGNPHCPNLHYYGLFVAVLGMHGSPVRSYMKVCVYGGGLAGLSVAYHLLQLPAVWDVTIVDPQPVGTGGASAIAGGYV